MIEVKQAATEKELDSVRALVRSFLDWLKQNQPADLEAIDKYYRGLEKEMDSLPGEYAAPMGALLLAACDGEVAGTVSLRNLGNQVCEMKHMFVLPKFQGKGIGRALATELIHQSRKAGYTYMRLDTNLAQMAARGLYRSLGFQEILPYYELAESVRTKMVFMELRLSN